MSMINVNPTIIQASVAQTAQTAEQVGRRRVTEDEQPAEQARQIREADEAHLLALDEDEQEDQNGVNVRISEELPKGSSRELEQTRRPARRKPRAHALPATLQPAGQAAGKFKATAPPDPASPLYRHLDVKA